MSRRSDGEPGAALPLFGIVHTARLADRAFTETFGRHGLAPGHFGVLASVNDTPGITQAEVARQLNVRPQTVARPVAALLRAGLISAEALGRGRPGGLHITKSGRDALDSAWPDVVALNDPAALGLTRAQADALLDALATVRRRLRDMGQT